ncbi:hypothetical protein ACI784_12340 [Geodermatophilus sp. SYSU D01186]
MAAPALTFLAPPSSTTDDTAPDPIPAARTRSAGRSPERGSPRAGGLRMTRGAREAATGMKLADGDIQRCLDAPDDVTPDPNAPSRTRFRRGGLTVLAGADGMVLRVSRAKR